MKVLVINLDRTPERLNEFRAEAARCGLKFERLCAVDGLALSAEDREALTHRHYSFQPVGPGEIGLALSHRAAWRLAAEAPDRWTAIFEDDARLADDIGAVLAAIEDTAPAAGIIRLETGLRRVVLDRSPQQLMPGRCLHRMWSWHGGTAGYVVRRDYAAQLLALTERISDPLDQLLFNPLSPVFRKLQLLQLVPAVVVQAATLDRATAGAASISTTGRQPRSPVLHLRHGLPVDTYRLWRKLVERTKRQIDRHLPGRTYSFVPFRRNAGPAGAGVRTRDETLTA